MVLSAIVVTLTTSKIMQAIQVVTVVSIFSIVVLAILYGELLLEDVFTGHIIESICMNGLKNC